MKALYIYSLLLFCFNWSLAQKTVPVFNKLSKGSYDKLNTKDSLLVDSLARLERRNEIHEIYIGRHNTDLWNKVNSDKEKLINGPQRAWQSERFNKLFHTVNLNFVTDRNYKKVESNLKIKFGSERSTVSYGLCSVYIPGDHKIGETVSSNFYNWINYNIDDYMHLVENTILDKNNFYSQLSKRINESSNKNALLFIHGYNVSFDQAAIRTAQIVFDLEFKGPAIFYSWPSQDNPFQYSTDETNIEWTQKHLEDFLLDFFKNTTSRNVYIIAHSMGNRAMTKAIANISKLDPKIKERVKEIILAAPDIDEDTFREGIAPSLINSCKRITIYGSATDVAIRLSHFFHSYKRLGATFNGARLLPGIDYIDATGIDTSFLGHSYIGTNRTVIADISEIINNSLVITKRFGLNKVPKKPIAYWKFRE
jgi:esterase/lipase superfamily enzyme